MIITAHRTRSAAVLAACVAIFAAAVHSTDASAATQPPRCRTPHLGVTLTHRLANMSNVGWTVTLTNDGRYACTIRGYPHLTLEDSHGTRERSSVTDGPTYFAADPGPSVITLAPGATATAHLGYGDPGKHAAVRAQIVTVRTTGAAWATQVPLKHPEDVHQGQLTVTAWKG